MFMQSNYVRVLSGCGYGGGVVGLSVASALVAVGGFAPCEACWRRVVGVSGPHVVQFPCLGLLQQFRMQFHPKIILVCFSSHSCVTCVLELHATLGSEARMCCGLCCRPMQRAALGMKNRGAPGISPDAPRPRQLETLSVTQRRSKPASHAARMGFASATS